MLVLGNVQIHKSLATSTQHTTEHDMVQIGDRRQTASRKLFFLDIFYLSHRRLLRLSSSSAGAVRGPEMIKLKIIQIYVSICMQ
jgi:hypothetical protein